MYTAAQVENVLQRFTIGSHGFRTGRYFATGGRFQWKSLADMENGDSVEIPDFGVLMMVEKAGFEENTDVGCTFVFKVTDSSGRDGFYVKGGWYDSYDGYLWDRPLVRVEPVVRTETVYERAATVACPTCGTDM